MRTLKYSFDILNLFKALEQGEDDWTVTNFSFSAIRKKKKKKKETYPLIELCSDDLMEP